MAEFLSRWEDCVVTEFDRIEKNALGRKFHGVGKRAV